KLSVNSRMAYSHLTLQTQPVRRAKSRVSRKLGGLWGDSPHLERETVLRFTISSRGVVTLRGGSTSSAHSHNQAEVQRQEVILQMRYKLIPSFRNVAAAASLSVMFSWRWRLVKSSTDRRTFEINRIRSFRFTTRAWSVVPVPSTSPSS